MEDKKDSSEVPILDKDLYLGTHISAQPSVFNVQGLDITPGLGFYLCDGEYIKCDYTV